MINKEFRNSLETDCAIFDNPSYDNSIIGITTTGVVVYDFNKMIEELSMDESMLPEEAQEFIEYNTVRMLPYIEEEVRPIIIYPGEDL